MIGTPGCRAPQLVDDSPVGAITQASNSASGETAGPTVEDLQHVGAGAHLPSRYVDRGLDERCR